MACPSSKKVMNMYTKSIPYKGECSNSTHIRWHSNVRHQGPQNHFGSNLTLFPFKWKSDLLYFTSCHRLVITHDSYARIRQKGVSVLNQHLKCRDISTSGRPFWMTSSGQIVDSPRNNPYCVTDDTVMIKFMSSICFKGWNASDNSIFNFFTKHLVYETLLLSRCRQKVMGQMSGLFKKHPMVQHCHSAGRC